MKISIINNLFQKRAGSYVNRELVREVELAREKAWRDVFFSGGFRP